MTTKLYISRIEISNLFDMFTYDIKLNDDLTIITSPNGYGKSTILRMINNLTSGNYYSFLHESFSKVVFYLSENIDENEKKKKKAAIAKDLFGDFFNDGDDFFNIFDIEDDTNSLRYKIEIIKNNRVITISDVNVDDSPTAIVELPPENELSALMSSIEAKTTISRIDYNSWMNDYTGEIFNSRELIYKHIDILNDEDRNRIFKNTTWLDNVVKRLNSYFISTDRIRSNFTRSRHFRSRSRNEKSSSMIDNLAALISEKIQDGIRNQFEIGRKKETTFPERLIQSLNKNNNDKNIVNERELLSLISDIQKYEDDFSKLGLISESTSRTTSQLSSFFDYENSGTGNVVLKIYLDDIKSKFKALDNLADQLRLFTETLNDLISFKEIKIDSRKGFVVQPKNGRKMINISELSSGEQHMIVMIGKLIFESKKGDLILIDEPEISLHPSWQEGYIASLEQIRKKREFKILMATHSTMIIGNRWNEVVELNDFVRGGQSIHE
ncbi:MAG: AAA family ATPase [Clostridium sp.]|uniref:AAA family ATPase n=1 Tax=Clostridium sp. TaxID=1506 RepID=UPI0029125F15|nr:AAA family ATPase [Clostridium sp.]MDU7339383.1 AAA family ATPase [Clostridium sp.]